LYSKLVGAQKRSTQLPIDYSSGIVAAPIRFRGAGPSTPRTPTRSWLRLVPSPLGAGLPPLCCVEDIDAGSSVTPQYVARRAWRRFVWFRHWARGLTHLRVRTTAVASGSLRPRSRIDLAPIPALPRSDRAHPDACSPRSQDTVARPHAAAPGRLRTVRTARRRSGRCEDS
jgi:hypothetical protein